MYTYGDPLLNRQIKPANIFAMAHDFEPNWQYFSLYGNFQVIVTPDA